MHLRPRGAHRWRGLLAPSFPSSGCVWDALGFFGSFDPLLLLLLANELTGSVPFGLKTLVLLVQNIENLVPPFFWRLRRVAKKPTVRFDESYPTLLADQLSDTAATVTTIYHPSKWQEKLAAFTARLSSRFQMERTFCHHRRLCTEQASGKVSLDTRRNAQGMDSKPFHRRFRQWRGSRCYESRRRPGGHRFRRGKRAPRETGIAADCQPCVERRWRFRRGSDGLNRSFSLVSILRVDEFRASGFGKANLPHYGQRRSSSALRASQVTLCVRS
jgi:hypothetical protein